MSRERGLLQKVVNHMWQGELVDEIKELLTQPEQDNFDKLIAVLDYIQGLSSVNREKE